MSPRSCAMPVALRAEAALAGPIPRRMTANVVSERRGVHDFFEFHLQ